MSQRGHEGCSEGQQGRSLAPRQGPIIKGPEENECSDSYSLEAARELSTLERERLSWQWECEYGRELRGLAICWVLMWDPWDLSLLFQK